MFLLKETIWESIRKGARFQGAIEFRTARKMSLRFFGYTLIKYGVPRIPSVINWILGIGQARNKVVAKAYKEKYKR